MHRQMSVAELEEGSLLVLKPRPPVVVKTDVQFESQYKALEELGKGKFGVVKKCQPKAGGDFLAAKFIRKTASSKAEVLREIKMMNMLHHKRLIVLHDAFETQREMIVIMELVTGGELFEKVVEEDHLTERQVIRYMKQVLFGVQHMHSKNMVHLDLKPENILCVSGGKPGYEEIKLIDFGMTRVLKPGENETAMCGTPEFVAPEVISFNPITLAADLWSIGVITYVLLSGLSPFMGEDDNETLKNVTIGVYDYEDEDGAFDSISDDVKSFIDACLTLDPKKRLTIDEALTHKWIQNEGSEKKLNTSNLKKFIARRRWQRTMNTIKAVSRLAGGLNIKGSCGTCSLGSNDFLSRVKKQEALEREKEQEAIDKSNEEKKKNDILQMQKNEELKYIQEAEKNKEIAKKEEQQRLEAEAVKEKEKLKKQDQIEAEKKAEEEKLKEELRLKLKEETCEYNDNEERKLKREEERKRRQDERNIRNVSMKPDSTSKDINQNVIKLNPEPSLDENKNHVIKDASVSNGVDSTNNSTMSCPISKTNKDAAIKKLSPNLLKKMEIPNEGQRGNRSNSVPQSPGSVKKNMSVGNVKDRAAAFQQGEIFWKHKR